MKLINKVSKKLFKLFYGNFGAKIALVINVMLEEKNKPTLNVHLDENGIVKVINLKKDISGKFVKLNGIRVVHNDESGEMRFIILDAIGAIMRGVPKLVDQVNEEFNKLDEGFNGITVEVKLEEKDRKKKRNKANPRLRNRKGSKKEQLVFGIIKQQKKKKFKIIKLKKSLQKQTQKKDDLKKGLLSTRYWRIYQFRRKVKQIIKKIATQIYFMKNAYYARDRSNIVQQPVQTVIPDVIVGNSQVRSNTEKPEQEKQKNVEIISDKKTLKEEQQNKSNDKNIDKQLSEEYNNKLSDSLKKLLYGKESNNSNKKISNDFLEAKDKIKHGSTDKFPRLKFNDKGKDQNNERKTVKAVSKERAAELKERYHIQEAGTSKLSTMER